MDRKRLVRKNETSLTIKHYSPRTVESYTKWVERFLGQCDKDVSDMTSGDVEEWLTSLAIEGKVARQTQKQAFYALRYFFEIILEKPFDNVKAIRPDKSTFVPEVLTDDELTSLFNNMTGKIRLMGELQFGSGARISELVSLRVKDIDFDRELIIIRKGKGGIDRTTCLPKNLVPFLKNQIETAILTLENDIDSGRKGVLSPIAMERKYKNIPSDPSWQFVFPAKTIITRNGKDYRSHFSVSALQRAIKRAALRAGIEKNISSHTLRHSFATHLARQGVDIYKIQRLLGHRHIETTMGYVHSSSPTANQVISPLDSIDLAMK